MGELTVASSQKSTRKAGKTTKASTDSGSSAGAGPLPNGRPAKTKMHGGTSQSKTPAVTIDRRVGKDRRSGEDRRKKQVPVAVERRKLQRRAKVNRRRQIDPTTCERDYSKDEIEFMNALEQYKRSSGRMFPTCSEVLEVLRGLGYVKLPPDQANQLPGKGGFAGQSDLELALNQVGRSAEIAGDVAD